MPEPPAGERSVAQKIAALPRAERERALAEAARLLGCATVEDLEYEWGFWARPSQLPPANRSRFKGWALVAGRGSGKTRTGAEAAYDASHRYQWLSFVAPTADDARDIMIEGESGVLNIPKPRWARPRHRPSKRKLEWPTGAQTLVFTADEPDRLRGKQHQWAWAEEVASWREEDSWDQLMFGLRLPPEPFIVVTTTPKPTRIIRDILADPEFHITRGSSYENRANLAPRWYQQLIRRYEGTRLGRQELLAELLEDVVGALWQVKDLDHARKSCPKTLPQMRRVVVGVDPGLTSDGSDEAGETGIVTVGEGDDGLLYVLADDSGRLSPDEWSRRAVTAYDKWSADRIAVEINQGGEMVEATIRHVRRNVPVEKVRASRGKRTRAEPVAILWEQGRARHADDFPELCDQLTTWVPDVTRESPDRMDALVWAVTCLDLDHETVFTISDAHLIG